jgi:hypothetical protein
MATESKKCAMDGCTCVPSEGKKYCSTYCEDAKGVTTLKCECGHPSCKGEKL